jgi:hypothetical protein
METFCEQFWLCNALLPSQWHWLFAFIIPVAAVILFAVTHFVCSALRPCSARAPRRDGISISCKPIAGILSGASIWSLASTFQWHPSWRWRTAFGGPRSLSLSAAQWSGFAATGYCIMANMLYWLGAEPRLAPETAPSGRCAKCAMSPVCINNPRARPA